MAGLTTKSLLICSPSNTDYAPCTLHQGASKVRPQTFRWCSQAAPLLLPAHRFLFMGTAPPAWLRALLWTSTARETLREKLIKNTSGWGISLITRFHLPLRLWDLHPTRINSISSPNPRFSNGFRWKGHHISPGLRDPTEQASPWPTILASNSGSAVHLLWIFLTAWRREYTGICLPLQVVLQAPDPGPGPEYFWDEWLGAEAGRGNRLWCSGSPTWYGGFVSKLGILSSPLGS